MTVQETIKIIDEPKGWLKITPSDIRNLNDYCKKLESENQQLILSGVVGQSEHLNFCMHNLDLTGKCFKCGEQYIRKEGNLKI